MDEAEYQNYWVPRNLISPIGQDRIDRLFARLAMLLIKLNGNPKSITIDDVIPNWGQKTIDRFMMDSDETADQIKAGMRAYRAQFNATNPKLQETQPPVTENDA